jgi:hypothetical protein
MQADSHILFGFRSQDDWTAAFFVVLFLPKKMASLTRTGSLSPQRLRNVNL